MKLSWIVEPLLKWYDTSARILPWRQNPTPYRVWISEIMLQQTRVEAVLPFFERFLAALPDLSSLADAEEEELLKLWEGLGYYTRVRNLQKAARIIRDEYGGEFPQDYPAIRKLPGIGDYTAGAIASIAFGQPEPAVDGNVLRVHARLCERKQEIRSTAWKKQLTEELRKIYPKTRCGDFTQALMELGAVVCLPNGEPKCGICPLHAKCGAFLAGTAREIPLRTERKERKVEEKTILLLRHDGKLALNRRPDLGLLAGMMELPGLPGFRTKQEILLVLNERNIPFRSLKEGIRANHIFSHVEWKMRAWEIECTAEVPGYEWVTAEELRSRISLPSAFQMFLKRKIR